MKNCFGRAGRLLVAGFACHLVVACSDSPSSGSTTAGDTSGGHSIWQISSSTDPMNDAVVSEARAMMLGASFDAEVTVQCHGGGDIIYTATTFDKAGQPAEMRREVRSSSYDGNVWVSVPYEFRIDERPSETWTTTNPQYTNQIALRSNPVAPFFADGSGRDHAEDMAAGSNIVIRLYLTSGEETYQWSQTDAAFRSVVDPCVMGRRTMREQLTQQADEKAKAEPSKSYEEMLKDASAAPAMQPASSSSAAKTGYPALKQGADYSAVRGDLISAGFSPTRVKCDSNCPSFPEGLSCSGTGINECRFVFERDGIYSIVRTFGEDQDPGFDRINPANDRERQEILRRR